MPARLSKNKDPSQQSCLTVFCQPARLKKKKKLRNPSQRETEFGVCQPAVAQASYGPASKVSFNTLPRKKYKSVGKICFTSNLHNIKEKRI